jgi:hypothetical protein
MERIILEWSEQRLPEPYEIAEFSLDNALPFQQFPRPYQSGPNQTKDF